MNVWSIQLAKARKSEEAGIPVLNTTVKCGEGIFAPTWEIVLAVKAGRISEEEYTHRYTQMMRFSCSVHRPRWMEVCRMPDVAVACMCAPGKFCHRHLLINFFEQVCIKTSIPFQRMGEWT